jgi:hypothetical protein
MKEGLKYTLVGLGVFGMTYLLVLVANKNKDGENIVEPDPQAKPDPVTNKAVVESSTIGMKVFSRVDGVKIRTQNIVNDGLMSNVYDTVPFKDTYMGKVVRILVGPKDQINPVTKRPFNWFSFQLDKNLYQAMQKNRFVLTRDIVEAVPPSGKTWVREDVVYLKK